MSTAAALGETARVRGYELAGARVLAADTPAAVEAAWARLPADVAVLILTPAAERILAERLCGRRRPLWAVLP